MRRPEELGLRERIYLPGIISGLLVTGGRFWRNLFLHAAHQFGFAASRPAAVTTQYPDARLDYGREYRGSHRLTIGEDGAMKCTACFLCATACPARCINIEAAELGGGRVEKYAVRYEIDTLRCVYCGLCVEACPCDAIRMDTAVHPRIAGFRRGDFIEDKDILMGRSRTMAERGEQSMMDDLLQGYRRAAGANSAL
jgi:NADH-quinone oxidoreductase subunit I